MMEIIQKTKPRRRRLESSGNFSKQQQLSKAFEIHRDPERLRGLLKLCMPRSLEESRKERFGKCAHPRCFAYGTEDHPLDLHHVLPRSQSRSRIDDYKNHLYLCGDFFPKNHHKGLHGQATLGRRDWEDLGVFAVQETAVERPPEEIVAAKAADLNDLLYLLRRDAMAMNLYRSNPNLTLDYGIKNGYLPLDYSLGEEEKKRISSLLREKEEWNPKSILFPKMR